MSTRLALGGKIGGKISLRKQKAFMGFNWVPQWRNTKEKPTIRRGLFAKSRLRSGLQVRSGTRNRPQFWFQTSVRKEESELSDLLTGRNFGSRFIFSFLPMNNPKFESHRTATTKLSRSHGGERSFTCSAADRSGSVAWCHREHSGAHCCCK